MLRRHRYPLLVTAGLGVDCAVAVATVAAWAAFGIGGWAVLSSVVAAALGAVPLIVLRGRPTASVSPLLWTMYGGGLAIGVATAVRAEMSATDRGTVAWATLAVAVAAGVLLAGPAIGRAVGHASMTSRAAASPATVSRAAAGWLTASEAAASPVTAGDSGARRRVTRVAAEIGVVGALIAVTLAVGRLTVWLAPENALPLCAALAAGLALAAGRVPAAYRRGTSIAAAFGLAAIGLVAAVAAAWSGLVTTVVALPVWHADLTDYPHQISEFAHQLPAVPLRTGIFNAASPTIALLALRPVGVGLPLALAILAVGALSLLPKAGRPAVLTATTLLLAVALPSSLPFAWWSVPALDLVIATVLMAFAMTAQARTAVVAGGASAVVLLTHAVVCGFARPSSTAVVLGLLVVLGGLVGACGLLRERTPDNSTPEVRLAGRVGTAAALLLAPVAGYACAVAAGGGARVACGVTLAAVAGTVAAVHLVRQLAVEHVVAAAVAVALSTVWATAVLPAMLGQRPGGYGAAGVLFLAVLAWQVSRVNNRQLARFRRSAWLAGFAPPVVLQAASVLSPLAVAVFLAPYERLAAVWSGGPVAGLSTYPGGGARGEPVDAAAVLLIVLAATVAGAIVGRHQAATAGLVASALALPAGAALLGAPWPAVPGLALGAGAAAALASGLPRCDLASRRRELWEGDWPGVGSRRWGAGGFSERKVRWAFGVAATVLCGSGLAGLLATPAGTLAGLGVVLVIAAVLGAKGRQPLVRTVGWMGAAAAAVCLGAVGSVANHLPPHLCGYVVLAVATILLLGGGLLRLNGNGVDTGQTRDSLAMATMAAGTTAATPAGMTAGTPAGMTVSTAARVTEAVAIDVIAHGSTLLAALLTTLVPGGVGHAATIAGLWGAVVMTRAMWPGESTTWRRWLGYVAAAHGLVAWWLVMVALRIGLPEAYSLPAAAFAAAVGRLVRLRRPDLGGWLAYGPALIVAFLPSLAVTLMTDRPPVRLLLLVAAAAVLLAGWLRHRSTTAGAARQAFRRGRTVRVRA